MTEIKDIIEELGVGKRYPAYLLARGEYGWHPQERDPEGRHPYEAFSVYGPKAGVELRNLNAFDGAPVYLFALVRELNVTLNVGDGVRGWRPEKPRVNEFICVGNGIFYYKRVEQKNARALVGPGALQTKVRYFFGAHPYENEMNRFARNWYRAVDQTVDILITRDTDR